MKFSHDNIDSWFMWYCKCKGLKILSAVSVSILSCQCSVKTIFYTERICANSAFLFNKSYQLQMHFHPSTSEVFVEGEYVFSSLHYARCF